MEARARAAEASEKIIFLQGQLEERQRADRRLTQEVGVAHRRAEETEGRVQVLHLKQSESVKVAQRLSSELAQCRKREEDHEKMLKQLQQRLQRVAREAEVEKEQARSRTAMPLPLHCCYATQLALLCSATALLATACTESWCVANILSAISTQAPANLAETLLSHLPT